MIDFADYSDRKALEGLWQSVFLEDSEITEYFFENIFGDTITPVIRVDGEIASALFLLDCTIGDYKGKCVYCAMTNYSHRGKGYMKTLLDYSYDFCCENGFDFLFLVPAEKSLFDYYKKCGFEKFGLRRSHTFDGATPEIKEKINFDCEFKFSSDIVEYWKNSCIHYGGEVTDFGLVFDDDNVIIRNAKCEFSNIPQEYKKNDIIIQGDINFGEDEHPAMIRTENKDIENLCCYVGITLE
ncbi:MAG: GNAT family N-acetyltransferase [Clostridia bacterium]|nr:GNAT family N-acetyltransferase [Clostridia bacterium]